MPGNRKHYLVISTIILLLMILFVESGILGIWAIGIRYIANQPNKYAYNSQVLENNAYKLTIDLKNIESNVGKELYNDGTNRIYVETVDKADGPESEGYRILFRSQGTYNVRGATLVSGGRHSYASNVGHTESMCAKMMCVYNNKTYKSNVYATTGLNYRNGDEFGFYISSNDSYETGADSLNENGLVEIIVSNLCINSWRR